MVQITGDGSKPEDYEAIACLNYAKFLESLPSASYHKLDANQLEVQPILGQDFKTLAQESKAGQVTCFFDIEKSCHG